MGSHPLGQTTDKTNQVLLQWIRLLWGHCGRGYLRTLEIFKHHDL